MTMNNRSHFVSFFCNWNILTIGILMILISITESSTSTQSKQNTANHTEKVKHFGHGGGIEVTNEYNDDEDLESNPYTTPRDQLLSNLLDQHNVLVPPNPKGNSNDNNNNGDDSSVTIEFGLSLTDLIQYDQINEILITTARVHMTWKDERLIWNHSDFQGVTRLAIGSRSIWKPTIVLHNSGDYYGGFDIDSSLEISATVDSSGSVQYNTLGIFKSICRMQTAEFPFDYLHCRLKFGFVQDEGVPMELKAAAYLTDTILREYTENPLWDIVAIEIAHNEQKHTGISSVAAMQDLTFDLKLRRKPLYYIWTVIMPMIITSYVGPFLFLIPNYVHGTAAGMGLIGRILCTLFALDYSTSLLRSQISDALPNTSDAVTMMGRYAILVNVWEWVIIATSIFQTWNCQSQVAKQNLVRMNGKNTDPVLTMTETEGDSGSGNLPSISILDKILAAIMFVSLTVFNGYMLMSLQYWQDARPHLK